MHYQKTLKQLHYEIVELRWEVLSAELRKSSGSPQLLPKQWGGQRRMASPILHLEEQKFTSSVVPVKEMLEFFIEDFGALFAFGIEEEK